MVPLARRASLIVMLSLFASVGTASAESWIAWVHAVFQSQGLDQWNVAGAAESLNECNKNAVTAAGNAMQRFRANNDGNRYVQTGTVIEVTYASGEKASMAFVCLPDTVDPRGPKETGR